MTSNHPKRISFGPFQLDCADQRLFCDDGVVSLRPKPFEVLQYLTQRPGKLVTKDEILAALWPDTMVSDTVLKVCIREIREALGDDFTSPRFIETSHRRGYRFIAEIEQSDRKDEPLASTQEKHRVRIESLPARLRVCDVVGRDDEIAMLECSLEKALEGERQIVFVTGEPGIGKTTLVEAFLKKVSAEHDIMIARGQCLEQYGASEAYLPMIEAVSRLCRELNSERTKEVFRSHAPTLLAQIPWLVRELGPALQREALGATRERLLREMAEAVEELCLNKTLVLLIEDLHWSDYSTLDLVSYLAHRNEAARLMVIGTYRVAEVLSRRHPLSNVKRELQAHGQCVELALRFLNEEAVAQYLEARFPSNSFPPIFAKLIHQRTDGNPLFIINLLDFLLTTGLVAQHGGKWNMTESLERVRTGMPDSVRQMIEKQIDSLSKEEQQFLEAASIAGVEFSLGTVSAALDIDALEAEEQCEKLARRSLFLRPAGGSESAEDEMSARYAFIHALYQDALYDRIPPTRRALLHRRTGEYIETTFGSRAGEMAAELSMHFEKARDYGRAVFYLRNAAENAKRRSANHETVELARRGLMLAEKLPDAPEHEAQRLLLQTSLAVALSATQGYGSTEVEGAYSRARELCHQAGSNLQLFPVLWGIWRFYLIRSDLKVAHELAQRLLQLAQSAHDSALLVEAHLAAGVTFDNIGEFEAARDHFELGASFYDPAQIDTHLFLYGHDPRVVLRCFNAWALWSLGFPDRAIKTIREGLELAEQLHHPETRCFALFFAAWTHQLRRESNKTLIYAEHTIELADQYGYAQWKAFGSSLRGWALSEQGRAPEGITLMQQTLDLYRAIGSEISRPHFLGLLAEALIKTGETKAALNALDEGLTLSEATGQGYYRAELIHLKGRVLAFASDIPNAEACLRQAIVLARSQKARSFALRAATSLSRLLQDHGMTDDARHLLAGVYGSFTGGFDTADLLEARTLLAGLPDVIQ